MSDKEIYNRGLNHFIKTVFCIVIALLIIGIPFLTGISLIFWSTDVTFALCVLSIIDFGIVFKLLRTLVEDI